MFRTFKCPGAITAARPIILSFGHAATDVGLPRLAIILYPQTGARPESNPSQPDSTEVTGWQSREGK